MANKIQNKDISLKSNDEMKYIPIYRQTNIYSTYKPVCKLYCQHYTLFYKVQNKCY